MRAFISGPYSGNEEHNTFNAMVAANQLLAAGHIPFVPHLSHFWHAIFPHDYEEWLRYDLSWLSVCDCLVRLPGESPGADREVATARELCLPVYFGVDAFLRGTEPG